MKVRWVIGLETAEKIAVVEGEPESFTDYADAD